MGNDSSYEKQQSAKVSSSLRVYRHTILMEASVRLMKVGTTSPSSPAASSCAASHNDKTVPTNCAKHSFHTRS